MGAWDIDIGFDAFHSLCNKKYSVETLNESDTRAKLITSMLVECLGWDEVNIRREEFVRETGEYLDYKLSTNLPHLIIEAKRSSILFDLPKTTAQREFKISGVISKSTHLMSAIQQARNYASEKGISYCCVTNGIQYVFFRPNNSFGKEWAEHKVAIFRDLDDIKNNFSEFCGYLSKNSFISGMSSKLLRFESDEKIQGNEFKTLETLHLNHPRKKNRNALFNSLEEVVRHVFQDLASEDAETEILEHCYVDSPRKKDKALPYLDIETQRLHVDKRDAGDFQKRVVASLTSTKSPRAEVIFLLGSVGVGKSTFIQRFRKVLAKDYIDELGIWLYLDFRGFSDTGEALDSFVYSQIESVIESDYEDLGVYDWSFVKSAYHSEYNKLKNGYLKPVYDMDSQQFEAKFSEYIQKEIEGKPFDHIDRLLKCASARFNKRIFLVFDNADQLKPETQNDIFLLAQKMAERLKGNALISMREESYWKNRECGPLNAFHTVAYHVQAPKLEQVLAKRFQYAKSLLESGELDLDFGEEATALEFVEVINRIQKTLLGDDASFIEFISAIAPRDTRRALDDVAAFIVSGHTNMNAILKDIRKPNPSGLLIPFHEFLNSVILRDHEVFVEDKSSILNVYGVSGVVDASNINRLAVLGRICALKNVNTQIGTGYALIEDIAADLDSLGISSATTLDILALLNARRLIETETTIRDGLEGSKYVRVTASGEYYLNNLSMSFGYLDIIVLSTPISDPVAFLEMEKIRANLHQLDPEKVVDRLQRVKLRVKLVKRFVDYLIGQFNDSAILNNKGLYSEDMQTFAIRLKESIDCESTRVVESATKVFSGFDG
jgi:DNA-binding PadR family transcriptional regulator/energy-coupling factor transporter ATP-binding protein EcfA2